MSRFASKAPHVLSRFAVALSLFAVPAAAECIDKPDGGLDCDARGAATVKARLIELRGLRVTCPADVTHAREVAAADVRQAESDRDAARAALAAVPAQPRWTFRDGLYIGAGAAVVAVVVLGVVLR